MTPPSFADKFPFKEFNVKTPKEERVSQGLLEEIVGKDRLLSRPYKTKNPVDREKANDAWEKLNVTCHTAREKHVNKITQDFKNDPIHFWKEIFKLLGLPAKEGKNKTIQLVDKDNNSVPMEDTAGFINDYFINIG